MSLIDPKIVFADWSGLKKAHEFVLMRWVYTNHIHIDSIDIALALLEASHKYELHALFAVCEESVIRTISTDTCAEVHYIASKVGATKALQKCERITAQYWDCVKSELNGVEAGANESEDVEETVSTTLTKM